MLKTDKNNQTIMGIKFDTVKEYKGVIYALSSNMIEGWQPTQKDVINLKVRIQKSKKEQKNG